MGPAAAHHYDSGSVHAHRGYSGVRTWVQHPKVFSGLEVAYRGMADAFANVVMLLVAAGVFAQGLSTIGFIQSLISIATSFGSASIILMMVLVILTMLAAMTTGSGNAPFYAFVEMILSWRILPALTRLTLLSRCCRRQTLGAPSPRSPAWLSL